MTNILENKKRLLTATSWINGGAASLFLVLYLHCTSSWREESKALWQERLNDVKAQVRQVGEQKIQEASLQIDPKIENTQRKVDSLRNRLDSIKATTQ